MQMLHHACCANVHEYKLACYIHQPGVQSIFFLIKPTRCKNFPNFILSKNCTCFGNFLCSSSGVFCYTFNIGIFLAGLMTASKQGQNGTTAPCPARSLQDQCKIPIHDTCSQINGLVWAFGSHSFTKEHHCILWAVKSIPPFTTQRTEVKLAASTVHVGKASSNFVTSEEMFCGSVCPCCSYLKENWMR